MLRTIIETLALLVLIYIAIGIRLMPRMTLGIIRKEMNIMSAQLDRLKALVLAQTSVVAGAVAMLTTLESEIREKADDPDAIRELADTIQANTASLAQATAIGTASSDEVHADDGGDGDDESAVDVDGELEPAPETEAAAGEGEQQQEQGEEQQG